MAECSIAGCGNDAKTRGWCPKHYQRWRTHGDPTKTNPRGRPTRHAKSKLAGRLFDRLVQTGGYQPDELHTGPSLLQRIWLDRPPAREPSDG